MLEPSKIQKTLIDKLSTPDDVIVLETLEKIKDEGNEHTVIPLIKLLASDHSKEIKKETLSLLYGLKQPKSIEVFMSSVFLDEFQDIRSLLFTIIWNGAIYPGKYLPRIVSEGLKDNFEIRFETLTILENLDDFKEEEYILESLALVKKYIAENPIDPHSALTKEILANLQRLDYINEN